MKRMIAILLLCCLVLSFAGCGAKKAKRDIFSLVEENYDTIVTACQNKDKNALLALDGIKEVNIVDGYVLVFCKGEGIAASSQDYGFYYSKNNIPIGVGCSLEIVCYKDTMEAKGSGYEGTVDHNTFYTEHIKGNIYFYSNAY